ncbi:hypothetical protein FACS189429_6090 [Bacteroidia bacterium]|nr:hypothetical protein FACS189429_6090 [Bacteroidia bacterium]
MHRKNCTIEFDGEYNRATVYDVSGRTVQYVNANTKQISIVAGIYLVKINIDGKDYMQKVIVK